MIQQALNENIATLLSDYMTIVVAFILMKLLRPDKAREKWRYNLDLKKKTSC